MRVSLQLLHSCAEVVLTGVTDGRAFSCYSDSMCSCDDQLKEIYDLTHGRLHVYLFQTSRVCVCVSVCVCLSYQAPRDY